MNTGLMSRRLIAVAIVLGSAVLALVHTPTRAREELLVDAAPQLASVARCRARGPEARVHAASLERSAVLHWQRGPFSEADALRAVALIAEAEACYRAAGDREREARTATLGRRYRAEVGRVQLRAPGRAHDDGWLKRFTLAMREQS